jgi:hypothetical protein
LLGLGRVGGAREGERESAGESPVFRPRSEIRACLATRLTSPARSLTPPARSDLPTRAPPLPTFAHAHRLGPLPVQQRDARPRPLGRCFPPRRQARWARVRAFRRQLGVQADRTLPLSYSFLAVLREMLTDRVHACGQALYWAPAIGIWLVAKCYNFGWVAGCAPFLQTSSVCRWLTASYPTLGLQLAALCQARALHVLLLPRTPPAFLCRGLHGTTDLRRRH